jgi:DNA gyrase subunit A
MKSLKERKRAKAEAIQNLIQLPGDDKVRAIIDVKDLKDEEFVNPITLSFVPRKGIIKKNGIGRL